MQCAQADSNWLVQRVPRYLRLFSYFATGFAGTFLAFEGYQRWTRKHEGAQPGGQKMAQ